MPSGVTPESNASPAPVAIPNGSNGQAVSEEDAEADAKLKRAFRASGKPILKDKRSAPSDEDKAAAAQEAAARREWEDQQQQRVAAAMAAVAEGKV